MSIKELSKALDCVGEAVSDPNVKSVGAQLRALEKAVKANDTGEAKRLSDQISPFLEELIGRVDSWFQAIAYFKFLDTMEQTPKEFLLDRLNALRGRPGFLGVLDDMSGFLTGKKFLGGK